MRMQGYKAKEFINLLLHNGWEEDRKNGSHITFIKDGFKNIVTIPCHKHTELSRPLTKRLLKEAGLN